MNPVSSIVTTFFEEFERANNAFDPDRLGPLFGDPVVGADPSGVVQAFNKADFLAGIPERQAYLRSLGFRFVKVTPLEEIPLSRHYIMVRTHGTMRLEKVPGEPADLVHDSIYVLFVKDGTARMVFTLSHEDPREMLQGQGFSPAGA